MKEDFLQRSEVLRGLVRFPSQGLEPIPAPQVGSSIHFCWLTTGWHVDTIHAQCKFIGRLFSTWMSLNCRRKREHQEKTHTNTWSLEQSVHNYPTSWHRCLYHFYTTLKKTFSRTCLFPFSFHSSAIHHSGRTFVSPPILTTGHTHLIKATPLTFFQSYSLSINPSTRPLPERPWLPLYARLCNVTSWTDFPFLTMPIFDQPNSAESQ